MVVRGCGEKYAPADDVNNYQLKKIRHTLRFHPRPNQVFFEISPMYFYLTGGWGLGAYQSSPTPSVSLNKRASFVICQTEASQSHSH